MPKHKLKTECERCGTCCLKGGPALHNEDKRLLLQKFIDRKSLITIRRGEPVFSLDGCRPEWTQTEIIKLKGKHAGWSCIFYDQNSFICTIYHRRPLECILLKCWDTVELEAISGKRLLSRFDIISSHEPIIKYIQRHEKECSLEIFDQLSIRQNGTINKSTLAELTALVNKDLVLRSEAILHLNLNLDLELFYFGRPLFKILSQFALIPREINGKIILIQA
ncbi:YkgJ family cysteine cluster protein [Thermodesulfobacteriota bacterium]